MISSREIVMYKYILWDIDGTVLNFEKSQNKAIRALFEKYNLGNCTDEMLSVYTNINHKYWEALERGELKKEEILVKRFEDFFELYGIRTDIVVEFNADYQVTLGDFASFEDNAEEILYRQKGKYRLIAVTNGTRIAQEKKLKTTGLDKVFDAVYISELVGYEKPNKGFFDYVFKNEGITDTSEAIIIGDSLTSDILGGINAGIDTCWYNSTHSANKKDFVPTYEIDDILKIEEIL